VDRDLVERGRHGDREAYELLARGSARRLYGVAHRILRDPDQAEDAVQQALLEIWLDLPKLRDVDRFEAWTYRLVVRASFAEAKRSRVRSSVVRVAPDIDLPDREQTDTIELRDELEHAFRALSPEHRAVIVLHHWLGLPLTEVADIVGIPYGTVRSRLHYAVRQLRSALADQQVSSPRGQPA
jgi:RNA polymerase sigma-70 factor (ECF subfamily)